MPRGDGTGPAGLGPMTGRAAGYCVEYSAPGYMNSGIRGFGRGLGRGFGRGLGCGLGRGRGRRVCTGVPYSASYAVQLSPKEEAGLIKEEAQLLEQQLQDVKKRIDNIRSSSSKE